MSTTEEVLSSNRAVSQGPALLVQSELNTVQQRTSNGTTEIPRNGNLQFTASPMLKKRKSDVSSLENHAILGFLDGTRESKRRVRPLRTPSFSQSSEHRLTSVEKAIENLVEKIDSKFAGLKSATLDKFQETLSALGSVDQKVVDQGKFVTTSVTEISRNVGQTDLHVSNLERKVDMMSKNITMLQSKLQDVLKQQNEQDSKFNAVLQGWDDEAEGYNDLIVAIRDRMMTCCAKLEDNALKQKPLSPTHEGMAATGHSSTTTTSETIRLQEKVNAINESKTQVNLLVQSVEIKLKGLASTMGDEVAMDISSIIKTVKQISELLKSPPSGCGQNETQFQSEKQDDASPTECETEVDGVGFGYNEPVKRSSTKPNESNQVFDSAERALQSHGSKGKQVQSKPRSESPETISEAHDNDSSVSEMSSDSSSENAKHETQGIYLADFGTLPVDQVEKIIKPSCGHIQCWEKLLLSLTVSYMSRWKLLASKIYVTCTSNVLEYEFKSSVEKQLVATLDGFFASTHRYALAAQASRCRSNKWKNIMGRIDYKRTPMDSAKRVTAFLHKMHLLGSICDAFGWLSMKHQPLLIKAWRTQDIAHTKGFVSTCNDLWVPEKQADLGILGISQTDLLTFVESHAVRYQADLPPGGNSERVAELKRLSMHSEVCWFVFSTACLMKPYPQVTQASQVLLRDLQSFSVKSMVLLTHVLGKPDGYKPISKWRAMESYLNYNHERQPPILKFMYLYSTMDFYYDTLGFYHGKQEWRTLPWLERFEGQQNE